MNNAPRNFGLIGIAGYIAERHLKAIKDTGNRLLASLDKFDCVGKIDNYFPESDFFVEYERFDRHIDKLKRTGVQLDYVSICSPNYLHDSHIRFALRHQADAICEKPVVLNPWNIDALQEIEKETGRHIFNILQLRYHPVILNLRERIMALPKNRKHDIDLTYITSRGNWYHISWKGDINKSGGIATNIGVHFFDMLGWIFGPVVSNRVHLLERDKASGYLELENARVRWFLSIDWNDLPDEVKENGKRTYRHITVNNEELEFSEGFTDLHTITYREILRGNGYGLEDARQGIEIVYQIRNSALSVLKDEYHPLIKK
ncbi:MAG TPA: Gfo/Idh/MocA family oxidoreductase [Bacteroidales bacterium]|jgi:UDP-N-acetyl-2-amino-2-deoxyglucuronate dehydrogenase|nr:Gfo/Idh/MocA family oxidoreductase [Bacteroidales bacterium]MDI9533029.1 Gfo/Idh/MocA family oxidoreductase [Bacteroidota bacterium]OPZ57789.1 MAG: UDP-N-acetyl-2-amino-2-deoxy-D-glucuronate oxidase [Bacteroidetes bacterium ADurb.BinA012]MBP8709505.1 Gfo/Idh/MocA family oxidoreductase [Bacteroidales bacterium]MZQ79022.1 Gfo/Idh/MocA family oxidoreductase [Bacteroidales bacterium]